MTEENLLKLEQKIRELVPRLTNTGCSNIEGHLCFRCADPLSPDLGAVLKSLQGQPNMFVVNSFGFFVEIPKSLLPPVDCNVRWDFDKPWEEQGEEFYEFLFKLFNLK